MDAGYVGDKDINFPSSSGGDLTPGIGVRYLTAAGPIRLDIGFRSSINRDMLVVTEVQDPDGTRRVVRLDALKRFESTGLLERLQLQLSLGEAF